VYLYDFAQAEGLARYLKDCGWFDVELTGIPEAGIMDVVRFAAGRPKIEETDNLRSAQEKIERRRAQDCERQRRKRARDRLEPKRTGPAPGP
jgi:hypothetical protein